MKYSKTAHPKEPNFSIDSWQHKACPPLRWAVLLLLVIVLLAGILGALTASAATNDVSTSKDPFIKSISITGATTVLSATVSSPTVSFFRTRKVWVTAYSSTEDQTDDTPFITASGHLVHDGIVATNLLPFGTKIKIPALFGDKIFTVEDRMHPRKTNNVDIWMSSTRRALIFGATSAEIVILGEEPILLTQK